MPRNTLLEFFDDVSARDDVFLVHDDGYRTREASYRDVAMAARAFAARLSHAGFRPDDKVVIWSENRIEWIVALWGTLLARAVLVPVDYRASADLVTRISAIVAAKIVLVGQEVAPPEKLTGEIWRLTEVAGVPSREADPRTHLRAPRNGGQALEPPLPTTLAEIIFTSGATAEPKGVTISHRNVLANIVPIEREVAKYRRYIRLFHPIRFLNLLPLSHMFGQSMATFVPPMLGGTVVFSHGYSPTEILRQIRSRRVSVLVCVPKVLDVLREHLERIEPSTSAADPLAGRHWAWRWWHYRSVHRRFGWKFWCIVCGAAPLPAELEAFWRKLGFLVVQGYGLTETAPIVTLNHPLRASKGTVGRPIAGVEVRIAEDGEILVRGENVTSGYYVPEGSSQSVAPDSAAFRDGWFHTGDIGELDPSGRLLIKGRKKEMIVTPQGLNVFPEDVERALVAQPGVKDAGVVGRQVAGEERIHAVLLLDPGADVEAIVRGANARLEDHQRIWSTSVWPDRALPRTEGTQKLKRRELQRWVAGDQIQAPTRAGGVTVTAIVGRYAAGRAITSATTLDELGLSSLDRVELMMALEEAFQTTLDESVLAGSQTVGGLEAVLGASGRASGEAAPADTDRPASSGAQRPAPAVTAIDFPSWNRTWPSWFLRRLSLPTWILPLARLFMTLEVRGLEHVRRLPSPVIFAANHQSHMDGPAILCALPARWRYRLAPAMAKEFFKAHFYPEQFSRKAWFTNSLNYYLACQFFNAFPLPQREAGTRQTLRYIGEVLGDGYNILIFPEGKRTERGEIAPFRPGIGMIGSRLGVPVVPVRIEGLDKVLHTKMKFPKRGPVRITFGPPLELRGEDYVGLTREVEEAVRRLSDPGDARHGH
jgi:long-chain acyl-CoA synthetase